MASYSACVPMRLTQFNRSLAHKDIIRVDALDDRIVFEQVIEAEAV
jgi:hypothetical protein